jgi:acetyl-CoA C-acetyltransferase
MMDIEPIAADTPVLVGIGTATRREEDYRNALEPMDLMLEAVDRAGEDTGTRAALAGTQYIAVPQGRWTYRNPAAEIARAIGAGTAATVLASVGVLQQSLISEACARIGRGEIHTALIAGADAGYRLLRAQIAKEAAPERNQERAPDIHLRPADELRHPVELRSGLQMPVGLYAIMDSAWGAQQGLSRAAHAEQLAGLGASFARIAAGNPHAWQRDPVSAASIRDGGPGNPPQALPYNRAHCSNWNVDQAAALLFCSAARAGALGIPRDRWIFPVASAESHHMVPVSARADIGACPGARLTGQAVLEAAGLHARDVDLVDLYSCFPLAVNTYAQAIGLAADRDLTITGGMAFAGGPYNNYLFQATCRAAELLRAGRGRTALLSCVSGVLTKQAFSLWSVTPPPNGFRRLDVTEDVARTSHVRDIVLEYSGPARVAGYTVLSGRGRAPRGVALVDNADGTRTMATTEDEAVIARLHEDQFVGRSVRVEANRLVA